MSDTSRVVLITAGASGIGRAIVMHFVTQNYHVHVCDVDQIAIDTLNRDMPNVSTTCADLTKLSDVDLVFEDLLRQWGRLDILVNNVGISGTHSRG